MARVARPAVVLAATACLLAACSGSSASLNPADIEKQIAAGLTEQAGGEFAVTCPSEVPAEADYTFTCTVADRTGDASLTVTVVEDDASGAFSWKVTPTPSASSVPG